MYMRDEVSHLEEVELHLGSIVQSAKNCAVADASFKDCLLYTSDAADER